MSFWVFRFSSMFLRLVFFIIFWSIFQPFFDHFSIKNRRKIDTKSNQKNERFLNLFFRRFGWILAFILGIRLYGIARVGPPGRLFGAVLGHLVRSASSFCSSWLKFWSILLHLADFFVHFAPLGFIFKQFSINSGFIFMISGILFQWFWARSLSVRASSWRSGLPPTGRLLNVCPRRC